MKNSNTPLDTRLNNKIESSAEDCPFPANFEEIFLQEFHRRRDERCLTKIKRWCARQWESCDFRWGSFLGGAATATAIIVLVVCLVGITKDRNDIADDVKEGKIGAKANADDISDTGKEKGYDGKTDKKGL